MSTAKSGLSRLSMTLYRRRCAGRVSGPGAAKVAVERSHSLGRVTKRDGRVHRTHTGDLVDHGGCYCGLYRRSLERLRRALARRVGNARLACLGVVRGEEAHQEVEEDDRGLV